MDGFNSDDDSEVLASMRLAFLQIHEEMREVRDSWPLRPNGYASTAGTTCSCALIRNNKIYTAHCGDSRIVLLTENEDEECLAIDLTRDHKVKKLLNFIGNWILEVFLKI
jgi:protein phosphatase 1D